MDPVLHDGPRKTCWQVKVMMAEHSTCSVRSVQLSVGSVHKLMEADKKPLCKTKVARLKDTNKDIRKIWVGEAGHV